MNDHLLFTPGPLTTSPTVKQAMLRDVGSRDTEFIAKIRDIRRRLLALGEVAEAGYEAILMQGSGTFSVEAVLSSLTPPNGKWLIIVNGAYGKRIAQLAKTLQIPYTALTIPENQKPVLAEIETALQADAEISHVAAVHCETTTGMFNPVEAIGALAQQYGKHFFVDAMSSFGAVPLNIAEARIDYLVSSANKCIQGVPGFGFAIVRREVLQASEGFARSTSLDLLAQWRGLEANGQFRFTPPTHTLLAFHQALLELEEEGNVAGRSARYRQNYETLVAGMRDMGFQEYLAPEDQGYIITSFRYPTHPNFEFETFYNGLREQGFVIYPGKVSDADCFRIGNIGHIFPDDVKNLLVGIRQTIHDMQVQL